MCGGTALHARSENGIAWGPMLVAYIARSNPTGPDDAAAPYLRPKALDLAFVFLPLIAR